MHAVSGLIGFVNFAGESAEKSKVADMAVEPGRLKKRSPKSSPGAAWGKLISQSSSQVEFYS